MTSGPARPTPARPQHRSQDAGCIEVWNDLVSPRDLLIALTVSVLAVAAACTVATILGQPLLFWGLGGSAIGFVIDCLIVAPKRDVSVVDDADAGIRTCADGAAGAPPASTRPGAPR